LAVSEVSSVLAIIPARSGSKGIPWKNWRVLGDLPLYMHAVRCAEKVTRDVYVTSDEEAEGLWLGYWIHRPAALAQDDTPMIEVVKHALEQIPGPSDQIIVLLQPTQPFRKPEHIKQAIALLQENGADSVVSVVELPKTHNPEWQYYIDGGRLCHWPRTFGDRGVTRRQDLSTTVIRDGTVYAFWRRTVERYGHIYGQDVRPLLIAPEDTCELDTEQDWAECVRRWEERHAAPRS
jgi:CMP-N,N'-diacetyllegionaminic acid synthase